MNKKIYYFLIFVAAVAIYSFFSLQTSKPEQVKTQNTVSFYCNQGKSISSEFSTSSVSLALSDGRNLVLPQAISGSGIRYVSGNLEFWSKGDNAFITENGQTTYENCIAGKVSDINSDTNKFTNQSGLFSFNYPKQFTVAGGEMGYTQSWRQNATTSGLVLASVYIPNTFQPKTNFGDSKFTIGVSSDPDAVSQCLTKSVYDLKQENVTINGVDYSKITSSDAGAGNFYETTSYRTIKDNQCYSIEYTIHSMNIGNYSPDQGITAFDKEKIQSIFEDMVSSFSFGN